MSLHWTYGVDSRGQVVSGQKRVGTSGTGTIFKGWDAAYAYDDIGNRTESRFGGLGGSSDPVGSETITYTANALNQYEEIANPRAAYVMGTAAYSTSNPALHTEVVINGQTADRVGVNFVEKLTPSGTGPKWEPLNFELVRDSVTQSFQQHLYMPPVQETLTYDLDGNLTGDGRWTYTWDGENRLVGMTTQTVAEMAGVPGLKLTFAYDGLSRRVQKNVERRTTSSDPWVLRSDTRFVYDGWNMVGEAEYLATAEDAPPTFGGGTAGPYWRRTYVWGEDLSGSLQGAGGVGGLLLINRHERGSKPLRTSWATTDLNGNVIGLVESNLKAVYEYDPFGKPLRVSEPEEDLNPFRFSTKYTDAETGLCYYGYRYYDAMRGRWINQDPIEEQGGINLYGVLGNDSVNKVDYLGMFRVPISGPVVVPLPIISPVGPAIPGVSIGPVTIPSAVASSLGANDLFKLRGRTKIQDKRELRMVCPCTGKTTITYMGMPVVTRKARGVTGSYSNFDPRSGSGAWSTTPGYREAAAYYGSGNVHRGHLLAREFGGKGQLRNTVTMHALVNLSSYKRKVENPLRKLTGSNVNACFLIVPVYRSYNLGSANHEFPAPRKIVFIAVGSNSGEIVSQEVDMLELRGHPYNQPPVDPNTGVGFLNTSQEVLLN